MQNLVCMGPGLTLRKPLLELDRKAITVAMVSAEISRINQGPGFVQDNYFPSSNFCKRT